MSFLLYNPLESMILILPLWLPLFFSNKINFRNIKYFFIDMFLLGTYCLVFQLPLNFLGDSLFYAIYNLFIAFVLMIIGLYFYAQIRFKIKNLKIAIAIQIFYYISTLLVITNNSLYSNLIQSNNVFVNELLINMITRLIQVLIIFILIGGYFMLKKKLIKTSKKNIGKTVASTLFYVGEPKLSEKLKAEAKNSK